MSGNQEAFQKAMNKGHSAAWDQQWEQAVECYRQALAEISDNAAATSSLGLALFELQRYDEALKVYQRVARLAPNDPVPLEKIARIHEVQGRTNEAVQAGLQAAELQLKAQEVQKALESWSTVLTMQPENLLARTRMAMVFERTGKKVESVGHYLAAASIIQRGGDAAKATQMVERAQQIMPENEDVRRAIALLKNGQMLPKPGKYAKFGTGPMKHPEARKSKSAKASQPAPGEGLDPVAETRQKAINQLASVLFEQAEESMSAPQSRRGLSAITRGLSGMVDDGADQTRILLHLGQAIESLTQNQDSQAAAELERAYEAGLKHPAALFSLGMLIASRDPQKSLRFLQEAVKHPDYALASNLLMGRNLEEQEKLREAASAYMQALRLADLEVAPAELREELDGIYEPLVENLGQDGQENTWRNVCDTVTAQLVRQGWRQHLQLARQQLPSPNIPLAEMLLQTRGSEVIELLSKVKSLAAQNKLHSAMEEAFYALQFAPVYLPLHVQIAEMLAQEGNSEAAISKLITISRLYNMRGEASNAIKLLNRAMQLAPMDTTIRMSLIDLLNSQGRQEEAMQQYIEMGDFYYQMSELDRARQAYLSAVKLGQGSRANRDTVVKAMLKTADIDKQRLDLRGAIKTYEQLRNLQPDDNLVRANIIAINIRLGQDEAALTELDGYIGYMESSNQRTKVISMIEGVLNEHPERIDIRKRLADLFIRAGQSSKAVEQLDQIADGLLVAKNKAGAIAVLEQIISLNPPNIVDYKTALAQVKG